MAWSVVAKRNLHGSPSRFILRFARRCFSGEESVTIRNPTIGCSRVGVTVEGDHIGARRSYADTLRQSRRQSTPPKQRCSHWFFLRKRALQLFRQRWS